VLPLPSSRHTSPSCASPFRAHRSLVPWSPAVRRLTSAAPPTSLATVEVSSTSEQLRAHALAGAVGAVVGAALAAALAELALSGAAVSNGNIRTSRTGHTTSPAGDEANDFAAFYPASFLPSFLLCCIGSCQSQVCFVSCVQSAINIVVRNRTYVCPRCPARPIATGTPR
jgi:hypothetical protein